MQGTIRKLGANDLSMTKRPLNGIKTTNPEEQDAEIMKMASLNASSPPNAEELLHLEQEKICHPQHGHLHQRLVTPPKAESTSTTIVREKTPEEVEDQNSSKSNDDENSQRASSSQQVEKAKEADEERINESSDEEKDDDEKDNQAELEQEMQKMKADADKLFGNNNSDFPLWWKMSISQAINEDSRNNNADLLSPSQSKTPGFYFKTNRGAGSDQNLPTSVLYEGAPTIKLEHPCTSFYGEDKSKSRTPNLHKNSSWNGKSLNIIKTQY